jgi:hypothetical protein
MTVYASTMVLNALIANGEKTIGGTLTTPTSRRTTSAS